MKSLVMVLESQKTTFPSQKSPEMSFLKKRGEMPRGAFLQTPLMLMRYPTDPLTHLKFIRNSTTTLGVTHLSQNLGLLHGKPTIYWSARGWLLARCFGSHVGGLSSKETITRKSGNPDSVSSCHFHTPFSTQSTPRPPLWSLLSCVLLYLEARERSEEEYLLTAG